MLNAYSRRKDGNALLSRSFRVREFACRDGSDPLFVDSALVQLLQSYSSTVWLRCRGREINAKSIMGVMMLAAGVGTPVTVRAEGPDEAAALDAVVDLFQRKFDEGQ